MTSAELKVRELLNELRLPYKLQKVIKLYGDKHAVVDFIVGNHTVLEVDGGYHFGIVNKDLWRDSELEKRGLAILHVPNGEVFQMSATDLLIRLKEANPAFPKQTAEMRLNHGEWRRWCFQRLSEPKEKREDRAISLSV